MTIPDISRCSFFLAACLSLALLLSPLTEALAQGSSQRRALSRTNANSVRSTQRPIHAEVNSGYITDLFLIAGGSSNQNCPGTFTKIRKDLNAGAGGDFIYLCYSKDPTYNYGYVTEIAVVATNSSAQAAPFRNDKVMWWLKGKSSRARSNTLTIDVNQGAGGKYILIYDQLGPIENAIRDVDIISSDSSNPRVPAGWTKINVDLNAGAGGRYIYLIYRR